MSKSILVVMFQVAYVLATPVAQVKSPPAKRKQVMTFCLVDNTDVMTVLIGSRTMMKFTEVLMMPATRRCTASLMQFCESEDRVQYSETGLRGDQQFARHGPERVGGPALEDLDNNEGNRDANNKNIKSDNDESRPALARSSHSVEQS